MSDADNVFPFPGNKKPVFIKRQNAVIGIQKYTRPPKEKKRAKVEHGLTEEHRKELDYLVREWAEISKKAKRKIDNISYGSAYILLFQYGLGGKVNGMDQIEDLEFNQAKDYLLQRIAIARKKAPKEKDCNSEYRNRQYAAIHARLKDLIKQGKVTEDRRREYQLDRYGFSSVADFSDDDLEDYRAYLMQKDPKFTTPRAQVKDLQQARENALRVLVGILEADAKGKGQSYFDPQYLPYSKANLLERLEQREPALFSGMSKDQFNKFWAKQQICKLKPGKPLGE